MDFLPSRLIIDKLKYCRKIIISKLVPCPVPESLQREENILLVKYMTCSFLVKLEIWTGSSGVREVCFRLDFVPRQLAIQTSKPPSARMKPRDCFGVLSTQQKPSCPMSIPFQLRQEFKSHVLCSTMSLPPAAHGIEVPVSSQLSYQHQKDHGGSSLS